MGGGGLSQYVRCTTHSGTGRCFKKNGRREGVRTDTGGS